VQHDQRQLSSQTTFTWPTFLFVVVAVVVIIVVVLEGDNFAIILTAML